MSQLTEEITSLISQRDALRDALLVAEQALWACRSNYECRGDYYDGYASQALSKVTPILLKCSPINPDWVRAGDSGWKTSVTGEAKGINNLVGKWLNFADHHDVYANDYEGSKLVPEFLADAHRLKAGVFRMCAEQLNDALKS